MFLWRGDHVAVAQLVDDFARYLYLPRLKNPSVLVGAVRDGLACVIWGRDSFAYADSYDDVAGRYRALPRAEVRVTLEIEATIPEGAPENVVRTVTENSRTLKLSSHGFERE